MRKLFAQLAVIAMMAVGAFLVFADYETTYNGIRLRDALLSPGLILIGAGLYFFVRYMFLGK